eukprot:SAG11_NODE_782_length_7192_cov_4.178063_1_plen_44_part_00
MGKAMAIDVRHEAVSSSPCVQKLGPNETEAVGSVEQLAAETYG